MRVNPCLPHNERAFQILRARHRELRKGPCASPYILNVPSFANAEAAPSGDRSCASALSGPQTNMNNRTAHAGCCR